MRLRFLGRCDQRWKVRVDWDPRTPLAGLTLGLHDEDGRPLGASVVAPAGVQPGYVAALGGPCSLPPGAVVRCVADLASGQAEEAELSLDAHHGLDAFVRGEHRLRLVSHGSFRALSEPELEALGAAFPCLGPRAEDGPADDVRTMLRDEFGVDPDDLDPDLVDALKV